MTNHTTVSEKRCSKCGEKFPPTTEHFHRDKTRRDGLNPSCKQCARANTRAWYAKNREELRKKARARYVEHPELSRESTRKWREANPERAREIAEAWGKRNPELRREYNRAWALANRERLSEMERARRAANPEKVIIKRHNRQARKRSLRGDFTVDERQFALEYFHNCCAYCGRQFNDMFGDRLLAMDHYIPLRSKDCPGTTATNMLPACHGTDGCNTRKGGADPVEWLMQRFGKRKAREILARIEAYFEIVQQRTDARAEDTSAQETDKATETYHVS